MLAGFVLPRSQQRENYKSHQGSELEMVEFNVVQLNIEELG